MGGHVHGHQDRNGHRPGQRLQRRGLRGQRPGARCRSHQRRESEGEAVTRLVTVLVLAPGDEPIRTERIDGDDSGALVKLVEGNLGTCSLPVAWRQQDWYAFCDDDAMIRPEPLPELNRWAHHLGHAVLRGPIVIIKTDYTGETRSLSRADVADLEMR